MKLFHDAEGQEAPLVVGLWGMGGIGKTTLAKEVFNRMRSAGLKSCFLEVGSEATEQKLGKLQHNMLKELLGKDEHVLSVDGGRGLLSRRLGGQQVAVVLDDVWSPDQLGALLVEGLGRGSRVVVTTRNRLLVDPAKHPCVRPGGPVWLPPHEVKLLGPTAAQELFEWHAF